MTRSRFLCIALIASGCSSFAGQSNPTRDPTAPKPARGSGKITTASGLINAMHARYDGKYFKTMTFRQDNRAYTTTGGEHKSQWFVHVQAPGKLRIAFLPLEQKSGLVQVGERVASFDNGIRVDFRPSVNPVLLLAVDAYAGPTATVLRGLDSLGVDTGVIRTDEWDGRRVYVIGAKAGDSTSSQVWIDAEHLRLVRFIQRAAGRGTRTIVSDIRVRNYREIDGYEIPTELLTLRNGRLVWREQRTNIRINPELPAGVFNQALWRTIPLSD